MAKSKRSPSELRAIFGDNLRQLARRHASVSELSRQLGINRTQFNRYLSGESFPRPDVLDQICRFFDVDARILLEPVGAQYEAQQSATLPAELRNFLLPGLESLTERDFPVGFYKVTSQSERETTAPQTDLVYAFRRNGKTLLRGYSGSAPHADKTSANREYRGFAARQADGIMLVMSHRNASAGMCSFVTRIRGNTPRIWAGYVTQTTPESPEQIRAARVVFAHLGREMRPALIAARARRQRQDTDPLTRRLLQPGQPFE